VAKYRDKGILVLIGMVMFAGYAQPLRAHDAPQGFVSPTQLHERLKQVKLLDIRSEPEYAQEHIDTAKVIPLTEISEARLTQLGFHKPDEIVVYANSETAAKKAKVLLEVLGYRAVNILNGGLTHWKEDGLPIVAGKMAVASSSQETPKSSAITIQPADHDLGTISKAGGVVTTTFTLLNTGTQAVLISNISASCGCTSAKISEEMILPGKSVRLEVAFDPNFHKEPQGKFSRTVFLETSEGIELQVKIHVHIQE